MRSLKVIILLLIPLLCYPQENQVVQDPAAKEILDKVAAKIKAAPSLQADYNLVVEDRMEKTKNSSSGSFQIKQSRYKIISEGNTVYFDGKTMWTYLSASNEVTITEPDNEGNDFLSNPASIFSFYNRDFKYRYVHETTVNGIKYHEIDLFPKNLNQPYSRIKLFISQKAEMPEIITSVGKDGIDYSVFLKNFVTDHEIPDTNFIFDLSKNKKVDIIDMRGVK
jgi:outer membrane lipoprotein carrier protein